MNFVWAGAWAVIPFTPPGHLQLFGPFALSAHGVAFLAAALVSLFFTKKRLPREYHRALEDVVPFMLLGAVIGARGLYYLEYPHLWSRPWGILAFWEGGLVSYGGMLGAVVAFVLYLRRKRLPIPMYCDALAPAALVGWGVGRIGCFLSWYGEYGKPSNLPWAFEVDGVARHPVALYLTVCLITAGALLMRVERLRAFRVTGLSFVAYGLIRGVCDTWRVYNPEYFVWTSRGACLVIVLLGLSLLRRPEEPVISPVVHEEESDSE